MAAEKKLIEFELVSPEAKLFSEPVRMAVIPGEEGQMGIGAGHAAYIVALKPGVVELFKSDGAASQRIFITGGFADITGERCVVLAEQAVNVTSLNQADIEQDIANLKEDLNIAKDEIEKSRAEKKLKMARSKLEAVTGRLVL